ncbi:SDR family oxidoreductase [Peptoniphilus stercorisuis]|uniref:Uncharacterized protein YbjT (DUF2867 family) n=1 Tax=Peptoniphilus stercorisuis TaxID=1436965 RepID=A0ABS4KDT3_9FIRM|nr:SDR family oxidoreductase [Peptoniphilus stercorisuis]MBP2025919.1 uncharacterized protein YbjT (DUF2867 family) [Peptoniphilus stercorisuis]
MKTVLILGANGKIATNAIKQLLNETDYNLKLLLRDPKKLPDYDSNRIEIIKGDVIDKELLQSTMKDVDLVYANLAGDNLNKLTENIIETMNEVNIKRLVFIASIGVLDEVPGKFGKWNNEILKDYLPPYKKSVKLIENSKLDYTIIRPAWLTDKDEVEYEITARDEVFKGTEVSRKSIADLVVRIIKNPKLYVKENIGVNKPNTDGDKPSWY